MIIIFTKFYTIKKPIGRGGFGVTYLAKSVRHRDVVVKTLKTGLQSDSKLREKFKDEARRLKSISSSHSNIVNFIDSFYEADVLCIVMEYIEGENLRTLLQRRNINEYEALNYIRQIGEALATVHKAGLIHRDIKPSNIILCARTNRCVLIDFGIARELSWHQEVKTNILPVSAGFSPLEQYSPLQKRGTYSDVYALSATLYVLLTGKDLPPSIDRSFAERSKSNPLIPPLKLNSKISLATNRAILKGLAILPEQRPEKVEEWLSLFPRSRPEPHSSRTVKTINRGMINQCHSITRYWTEQLNFLTQGENSFSVVMVVAVSLAIAFLYINAPFFLRFLPSSHTESEKDHRVLIADYSALEEALINQDFLSADEETFEILRSLTNTRSRRRYLNADNLDVLSCDVLIAIDNLWLDYSESSFGFSIQRSIWTNLGGRTGIYQGAIDSSIADKFIGEVGWKSKYDFRFDEPLDNDDLGVIPGHFPLKVNVQAFPFGVPYFSQKLDDCQNL